MKLKKPRKHKGTGFRRTPTVMGGAKRGRKTSLTTVPRKLSTSTKYKPFREKNHQCRFCVKTYPSVSNLNRHVRAMHAGQAIPSTTSTDTLKLDTPVITPIKADKSEDSLVCMECSAVLANDFSLKRHIIRKHTVPSVVCDVCLLHVTALSTHTAFGSRCYMLPCALCHKRMPQVHDQ